MNNTLSLLLLLLLQTPGPGGCSGSTQVQDCLAELTISDVDDVDKITFVHPKAASENLGTSLYVHPKHGFKGITLQVEEPGGDRGGVGELHDAWFPLEDTCFQGGAEWWMVRVTAGLYSYNNHTYDRLTFRVWVGKCYYWYDKTGTFISILVLRVMGHGTSGWRRRHPDSRCTATGIRRGTHYLILPSSKTPPPRSDNITTRPTSRSVTTSAKPTAPATPTAFVTSTPPATPIAHATSTLFATPTFPTTPTAPATPTALTANTVPTPSPAPVSTEVTWVITVIVVAVTAAVTVVVVRVLPCKKTTTEDRTILLEDMESSPEEQVTVNI